MEYALTYPTSLEDVNPDNDNIDVSLQLDDGRQYTLVVATPTNVNYLMERDNLEFLTPGLPFLFVKRITEENIRRLVEALLNQGDYFLRIYGSDIQESFVPASTLSQTQ